MSTEGVVKPKTKSVSIKTVKPKKVVEQAVLPSPVEKKKSVKKSVKVVEQPVEQAVEQPVEQAVEQPVEPVAETEKLSRKKKTYQQLVTEIDSLNSLVDTFVQEQKDTKLPQGLSHFLKSLEKSLKKAKVYVQKIGKGKGSTSGSSSQSGFQKPVQISAEVAKFTGWDVSEPKARVEVTNFVCEYIKKHSLQSPTDKRIIVADQKLSQLLEYDASRDGDLTYATIQKLLAKHYTAVSSVKKE